MDTPTPGPRIAQGRTAEVYAWGDGQILKLFYDWCPPNWVQQEIEMGRLVAPMTLPTPKLLDVVEINGREGLVYERVEGPSMLQRANAKPWLVFGLARQLAELHAAIHGQSGDGLPSLYAYLQREIAHVEALPPDLKTSVLRVLDQLPDGRSLCHFDFHPDQVLLTPGGPMVIDWMTAHQGNPLADAARTTLLLTVGQAPYAGRLMRASINMWRGFFRRSYLARYLALRPQATRAAVKMWIIPVAAARLQERIAGEEEPLLALIRSYLPKVAPS